MEECTNGKTKSDDEQVGESEREGNEGREQAGKRGGREVKVK
jgi:hypothetical protein